MRIRGRAVKSAQWNMSIRTQDKKDIIQSQGKSLFPKATSMQPFPPLKDFSFLLVPLTIRLLRPISTWYFILECFAILTYRSGTVYQNYCTMAAYLFNTTILLYFNLCLLFRIVQRHIHYRLGQSILEVAKDPQAWISSVEAILILIFLSLGYLKYKQLRAVTKQQKNTQLFS